MDQRPKHKILKLLNIGLGKGSTLKAEKVRKNKWDCNKFKLLHITENNQQNEKECLQITYI